MFCKGCGKKIEETATICPYCGRTIEKLEGGVGFFDLTYGTADIKSENKPIPTNRDSVDQESTVQMKRMGRSLQLTELISVIALILGAISLCIGLYFCLQSKGVSQQQQDIAQTISEMEQKLQGLESNISTVYGSSKDASSRIDVVEQTQEEMSEQLNEMKEQLESAAQMTAEPKVISHSDNDISVDLGKTVTLSVEAEGDSLTFQWYRWNGSKWIDILEKETGSPFTIETKDGESSLNFNMTVQTAMRYLCIPSNNGQAFDYIYFVVKVKNTSTTSLPTRP